jgi:hypothetical protein
MRATWETLSAQPDRDTVQAGPREIVCSSDRSGQTAVSAVGDRDELSHEDEFSLIEPSHVLMCLALAGSLGGEFQFRLKPVTLVVAALTTSLPPLLVGPRCNVVA